MPRKREPRVELKFPSKLGFEKIAMESAGQLALFLGFSEDRIQDLRTAVSEAVLNAIEHGNKFDARRWVQVIFTLGDESLAVRVLDQGGPTRLAPPSPNMSRKISGEEPARGMGLFLIKNLVDEWDFSRAGKKGNCIRLVVHLDRGRREPSP